MVTFPSTAWIPLSLTSFGYELFESPEVTVVLLSKQSDWPAPKENHHEKES